MVRWIGRCDDSIQIKHTFRVVFGFPILITFFIGELVLFEFHWFCGIFSDLVSWKGDGFDKSNITSIWKFNWNLISFVELCWVSNRFLWLDCSNHSNWLYCSLSCENLLVKKWIFALGIEIPVVPRVILDKRNWSKACL